MNRPASLWVVYVFIQTPDSVVGTLLLKDPGRHGDALLQNTRRRCGGAFINITCYYQRCRCGFVSVCGVVGTSRQTMTRRLATVLCKNRCVRIVVIPIVTSDFIQSYDGEFILPGEEYYIGQYYNFESSATGPWQCIAIVTSN